VAELYGPDGHADGLHVQKAAEAGPYGPTNSAGFGAPTTKAKKVKAAGANTG
jgi:hypothetical protein